MMTKMPGLAPVLLLAACSQPQDTAENATPPAANEAIPPSPSPSTTSTPSPAPAPTTKPGRLPAATGAQPRYIGRWAATRQLCEGGAWRFYATHLETAGEVSCTFGKVDTVPGGYDIHATCTAEAPPAPDTIKLRFAESAQAMLVDSKTFKSVGLTYCGPLG
ncbi:MAG TPA: hypothetical protein VFT56_00080 [Sphingomonas sp.]|nr:hypothetical protein [Sphingomonas sp.]